MCQETRTLPPSPSLPSASLGPKKSGRGTCFVPTIVNGHLIYRHPTLARSLLGLVLTWEEFTAFLLRSNVYSFLCIEPSLEVSDVALGTVGPRWGQAPKEPRSAVDQIMPPSQPVRGGWTSGGHLCSFSSGLPFSFTSCLHHVLCFGDVWKELLAL